MVNRRAPSIVVCVLLALGASGCRKKTTGDKPAAPGPTPLALRPAAEARTDLVAEVVAPNLDRSFGTVAALAAKLGLPTSAADLRRALLSGKGAPPQAFDQLDLAHPVALAVVVAPPPAVGKSFILMAVALKDPSAAAYQRWLPSWATIKERDGDAVKVATTTSDAGATDEGDRPWAGWLLHRDGAICIGHEKAALVAGCSLALEARKAPAPSARFAGAESEHLRAMLLPEGVARAQGTNLDLALAKARADMQRAAASDDTASPPPLTQEMMDRLLTAVGDLERVSAALFLDEQRGLALGLGGHPRAGSALEKTLADPRPFVMDPALLYGPTPAALYAMGSTVPFWDLFAGMVSASQSAPAAGASKGSGKAGAQPRSDPTATAVAAFKDVLQGPSSGRARFVEGARPELRYDFVYPLKADAAPERVLTAWQALAGTDWAARALGTDKLKVKVSTRREGATVLTRMSIDPRTLPREARTMRGVPPFDGRPLETRALVDRGRLLMVTGADGKAALEALRAAPPADPPSGTLAGALAEARGEDGFYFADLAPMLRAMVLWADTAARAGGGPPPTGPMALLGQAQTLLANVELATWASHRTGRALDLRWRVPTSTLETMAGIVRQSLGMLGGALATPPATP